MFLHTENFGQFEFKVDRAGHSTIAVVIPASVDRSFSAGRGLSSCAPGDQYCRRTGRKLAFTRAISHLPKDVRAELWAEYWRRHRR